MEDKLIYITVPYKYEDIYSAMLVAATHYGELALKDCKCQCDNNYCTLMECFNLFHSVIAAYTQQQEKLADTIAKYIIAKLKTIGVSVSLVTPAQSIATEFIYSSLDDPYTQTTETIHFLFIDGYYTFERIIDDYAEVVLVIPKNFITEKAVIIDNGIESDINDYINYICNISIPDGITPSGNTAYVLTPQRPFDSGTKLKILFKKEVNE